MIDNNTEWSAVASQFTIRNDYVFSFVMSNPDICTPFLQMAIPEVKFTKPVTVSKQVTAIIDSTGKGIRLDIQAIDEYGQLYDIEMQNVNSREDLKLRIRYYGSVMDCDTIRQGDKYRKLPNGFIIFICNFDFNGFGKSIYNFTMRDRYDSSIELQDGRQVILINCRNSSNFPNKRYKKLAKFVKYIQTNIPTDDYTKLVHDYVQESKKNPAERKAFMEFLSLDSKIAHLENENMELKTKYDNLETKYDELAITNRKNEEENRVLKAKLAKFEKAES